MGFFIEWIGFATIMFVASASPGPDFVVCVRNAVLHSTRAGILSAIGIGLGICVHLTYSLFGLAALIAQSVMIFNVIKFIGAGYLIYIGFQALRSKGYGQKRVVEEGEEMQRFDLPTIKALRQGFVTNLLNPKAALFFLALLPQFMGPETMIAHKIILGATAILVPTLWFIGVSVVLNQRAIRRAFLRSAQWIDRICGALLMALGIKLAFTRI